MDIIENRYYFKYLKYKQKYLTYKNKINNIRGGDKKIMTKQEINNLYGHKYRFYDLYQQSPQNINNLMNYFYSNFHFNYKINLKQLLSNKISDAEIYLKLRRNYTNDSQKIIQYQNNLYRTKHISNKIKNIQKIITKHLPPFSCHKILDVGTEDVEYLIRIEKMMNCNAYGLNIKTGYSHYASYDEAIHSNKIILYDGIHFPFQENEFDLVTIIAVLHHIKDLDLFIKGICYITKNIYIKDNDMNDLMTQYNVEIQHEVYEGILYPNKPSPLYTTTNETVIKTLQKYGFKIIYNSINTFFTKSYVILATKKFNS